MEQPLVSVVTPVYNGEAYLRECIESVLRQTYQNWEYIIVNNRSTDATLAIAEEYARCEPRIRVLTNKEFVDVRRNENIALGQMSPASRFCKVVHADDWLFPECIGKMVEVAMAKPSIGLVSAYRLDGTKLGLGGLPYPSHFVSGREIARATFLEGLDVFGSPTSTLIRADLIRGASPFYNEESINEDTEACYALLAQSDFGFVHQILTFTRRHERSITSQLVRLNMSLAGYLMILMKYGPVFLTPEEFARTKREYIRGYYSCLARHGFLLRRKGYWQFHRDVLRKLGISISLCRVVATSVIEVAKFVLTPSRWRRRSKLVLKASRSAGGNEPLDR